VIVQCDQQKGSFVMRGERDLFAIGRPRASAVR
jgi:hypothetical protein